MVLMVKLINEIGDDERVELCPGWQWTMTRGGWSSRAASSRSRKLSLWHAGPFLAHHTSSPSSASLCRALYLYIIIFHAGWLQPRSMPLVHLEHDLVLVHVLSFWRFPGERPVGTPANLLPRRRPLGAVVDLPRRRGQSGHSSSATASALTHHTAITIIFTSSSRKSSPQNVWIDVDQALRPCLLFSLKISFSDWFWGMFLLRKWGGGHSMVDCKEKSRECGSRCVSAPLDQEAEEVCIA